MTVSALDEFLPSLIEMMKHPPDPSEAVPLGNRPATALGVTITFHVLTWLVVGCRLHTRLFVVRKPGIDDIFVVIAAVWNLVGLISFIGGIHRGIGKHIIYLGKNLESTMVWFYVANAAYCTTTVCIKLSLLFQYLRLFREGYRRTFTQIMLVVVIIWGSVFTFMSWFPCFPVSGYWNKHQDSPVKCYGFGYRTMKEAKNTLFAFSGSNMGLDIIIFSIPITEYFRPGLMKKQVLAMTGLFALGMIVVLMAFLRLWSGLKYNNTITMWDFTWWLPEVIIFSCLEVDFAIMCASMPIFWPTVVAVWSGIFVTQEVTVTNDRRSRFFDNYTDGLELNKTTSLHSQSSIDGLAPSRSRENESWFATFDPETGKGPGSCINHVEIKPLAPNARIPIAP